MTRIVWTNFEKTMVFDSMVQFFVDHPGMSGKQALLSAQQVLPYERRGRITDQRVFSYKDRINEARAQAKKIRDRQETVVAAAPEPVAPIPAPEPLSIGQLFEQLVDAVAQRVTDRVLARLSERTDALPRATLDEAFGDPMGQLDKVFDSLYPQWKQAPLAPTKPLLPTVTIIGLNGQQVDAIKSSYPKAIYCFMTAEEAKTRPAQHNDHVILMTKFINHAVQTKYRKHPNLRYCNGGVSDLKHQLQIIFHKETA